MSSKYIHYTWCINSQARQIDYFHKQPIKWFQNGFKMRSLFKYFKKQDLLWHASIGHCYKWTEILKCHLLFLWNCYIYLGNNCNINLENSTYLDTKPNLAKHQLNLFNKVYISMCISFLPRNRKCHNPMGKTAYKYVFSSACKFFFLIFR